MQGIERRKQGELKEELVVKMGREVNIFYEESLVRRWIKRIEVCEKDRIKILFKE